uniref:Uncharacterized protein n=1 Tax=mine drainage metagenome TaxID=410659 RepID=E6QMX1_9ZZZZ
MSADQMTAQTISGVVSEESSFKGFCKAILEQTISAMKAHPKWVPFSVSANGIEGIDQKLVVELSWVFGAKTAAIPFDTACEEVGVDARQFRQLCARKYPRECAYVEKHLGA